MERLNLRQLEIFSAVVDAGSFTAAAEKLYLAQSTVSDNVRALEELLHLKLFHRESKRRLTLTLEGKRVYRYAQDILGRCSALLLDVAVDSALELTLGASTVPAQSLLPGYMARFARENPACRCTLLCGDSAAVQQMLLNGDIHLGFVGSADDRQDLIYEPIAEDRLVLITPNTPRFAALKTQGVLGRELFREPFLFRERGSGTQKVIDNYLSEIRLDPQVIHTVAYVSDPTVLQRLVAEGTGVSILSALAVQEAVAAGLADKVVEAAEQPASSLARNIARGWERLLANIGLRPGPALPADRNVLHFDGEVQALRSRSAVAADEARRQAAPTSTQPREDPSCGDTVRSANERAYAEDARRMRN